MINKCLRIICSLYDLPACMCIKINNLSCNSCNLLMVIIIANKQ